MNDMEALHSVLEVAIGIAGFSGVIIAFNKGNWTMRQMHLLPTLLDLSFIVLFLGFLPMILDAMGLAQDTVWRCASGISAFYLLCIMPLRSNRLARLGIKELSTGRVTSMAVQGVALVLSILNIVMFATFWPYLVVVVTLLLLAFGVFAQLISEVWTMEVDDHSAFLQSSTERR